MQSFRVPHASLYASPNNGVQVQVPVGTRSIRLCPTAGAVPVEVWPDTAAPDARSQDGQLFWYPGETLYPGDTLLLDGPCTTIFVRLPPANNAGALAYITAGGSAQPFGEDARRGMLYGGNAYAPADFENGPAPTSDGAAASIKDGMLVFTCSRDLQLHSGQALSTLPATLRLPASYRDYGAFANLDHRASVTNTLVDDTGEGVASQIAIIAPWHIAPAGLLLRHQRVRLRIVAGQAWDGDEAVLRFARSYMGGQSPAWNLHRLEWMAHGAVRPALQDNPPQQSVTDGYSEVIVDLGNPSELFALGTPTDDQELVTLAWLHNTGWATRPSVSVEWLLDEAPSTPGQITAHSELRYYPSAGETHAVACHSPKGSTVVKVLQNVEEAGDGEVRAWPLERDDSVALSSTPSFAVPLADMGRTGTVFTLPQGTWAVGIYGGSTGCVGRIWTEEG